MAKPKLKLVQPSKTLAASTDVTPNTLSEKAVLVSVHIRAWTGRKLDKQITDAVNEDYDAKEDAGRYNKLLIAKAYLTPAYTTAYAARGKFHTMTQPWLDGSSGGTRILPTALFDKFAATFADFKEDFNAKVEELVRVYPRAIEERKAELGEMFKPSDYPAPDRLRGLFDMTTRYMPCPNKSDFRVNLAKEHMEDIKSDLEREMKQVLQEAMRDPVRRITTTVGHMVERLKAYKPSNGPGERAEGLFRASLVENIRDLVELLPAFNLTENETLAKITERMDKELCAYDARELKENANIRKEVAKSAASILAQAESLMG